MCIFCKIINGEIPSFKVHENDDFLAFLDIGSLTKGHTLIVPKKHYENFLNMPVFLLEKMQIFCKEVVSILEKSLDVHDFNFLNNCGSIAGQTVMHYHYHVIPRFVKNEINNVFEEKEPNFDKLKEVHNIIVNTK